MQSSLLLLQNSIKYFDAMSRLQMQTLCLSFEDQLCSSSKASFRTQKQQQKFFDLSSLQPSITKRILISIQFTERCRIELGNRNITLLRRRFLSLWKPFESQLWDLLFRVIKYKRAYSGPNLSNLLKIVWTEQANDGIMLQYKPVKFASWIDPT